jgi:SEC-C motif-containing protein
VDQELICPCCSGKLYRDCCSLYHQGKKAESAEALMRSRYSAYALNHLDYLIRTIHPRHPSVSQNLSKWKEEILNFALNTEFKRLAILDSKEQGDRAVVVFVAYLAQNDEDTTFTERSFFTKVDGQWLYVNGDLYPGEHLEIKA